MQDSHVETLVDESIPVSLPRVSRLQQALALGAGLFLCALRKRARYYVQAYRQYVGRFGTGYLGGEAMNDERKTLTFEERMKLKREEEAEQLKIEAEKLREEYLRRTNRKEMKP